MLSELREAFAFLTILIKGKIVSNTCVKNSVFYYPIVGMTLGLIYLLTSVFLLKFTNSIEIAALSYLILAFFLTRGLHHDGLADLADAWGSGARGDKFRRILKDSHIGSFGVIALILYFMLIYIIICEILDYQSKILLSENLILLFLAPYWGRIGLLALPAFGKVYIPKNDEQSKLKIAEQELCQNNESKSEIPTSLSQNLTHKNQKIRFISWFGLFSIFSLFHITFFDLVFILFTSFIFYLCLFFLAKRENGYNGDFVGALCLLFELAVFLSIYV